MRTIGRPGGGIVLPQQVEAQTGTEIQLRDDEGIEVAPSYGTSVASFGGIKDIAPKLQELGKIKIGGKSDREYQSKAGNSYRAPVKYDHFVITKDETDDTDRFIVDVDIMERLGGKPRVLDVMLLSDDIATNFVTYYGAYKGGRLLCSGDGVRAVRLPIVDGKIDLRGEPTNETCPCDRLRDGVCKPHGILTVMLAKQPILGGVYKFRTTSFESISSILGSLQMIAAATGGRLAGLPMQMTLSHKTKNILDPKTGQASRTKIQVVNLTYCGDTESLMRHVISTMESRVRLQLDMARVEENVRGLLSAPPAESEDESAE